MDQLVNFVIGSGRIGFRRGSQVEGRLDDRVDAFGHADILKRLGGGVRHHQTLRIGQADIFAGQNDQAAQDEARFLAGQQHFCQPVESCVRVTAAHRLNESRDRVVMGVFAVINHSLLLNALFGRRKVHYDRAIRTWFCRQDRNFQGVESLSGVAVGQFSQMTQRVLIGPDSEMTQPAFGIG
ncbi:hypothetical protein SDC9_181289 [bioreactor metagenome]|uniref:Uncharacterized protein n=1 Tax=bioreactor metagenome TaxID=1076179 RepID=A0A645H455_9ZZZZ